MTTIKAKNHWALVKAVHGKPAEILFFADTSEALVNKSEQLASRKNLFVVDLNKWTADEAVKYWTGRATAANE